MCMHPGTDRIRSVAFTESRPFLFLLVCSLFLSSRLALFVASRVYWLLSVLFARMQTGEMLLRRFLLFLLASRGVVLLPMGLVLFSLVEAQEEGTRGTLSVLEILWIAVPPTPAKRRWERLFLLLLPLQGRG